MNQYRPITPAVPGTPCGWTSGHLTCGSGKPAVHVLTTDLPVAPSGTALCAYHSPYDVRPDDGPNGWMVVNEVTGAVPVKGDTVTDFRGEEWRLDAITRAPEGNSTGRVLVSRPCGHADGEHPFYCRGREQGEYFPSVFGLVIAEDLASCYESDSHEDGTRAIEEVHERGFNGSCRCGKYRGRS